MGMDIDYMVAKQAIEELEKLLSNQKHGERGEIADEIINFVETMKLRWTLSK
jgi:hypothetical protein